MCSRIQQLSATSDTKTHDITTLEKWPRIVWKRIPLLTQFPKPLRKGSRKIHRRLNSVLHRLHQRRETIHQTKRKDNPQNIHI